MEKIKSVSFYIFENTFHNFITEGRPSFHIFAESVEVLGSFYQLNKFTELIFKASDDELIKEYEKLKYNLLINK